MVIIMSVCVLSEVVHVRPSNLAKPIIGFCPVIGRFFFFFMGLISHTAPLAASTST